MKPIFSRGTSLHTKLFLAIICSILLMLADNYYPAFKRIRNYLDTGVSPVYYLVNSPRILLDNLSGMLNTREKLQNENQLLKQQVFLKDAQLLRLDHLEQENARLRELLGSPLLDKEQRIVAQTLFVNIDPESDQVIINKGSNDGVYEGQPVISDKGIIGQVIADSKNTSRILLICNPQHAIPVQVLRNDLRAIAVGHGCNESLELESLPTNADIRVGDKLVSSGFGGKFPEGYPVAIVSSIKIDTQRAYKVVNATPTADLQHLRYVLLLWYSHVDENFKSPAAVKQIAERRLSKLLSMNSSLNVGNNKSLTKQATSSVVSDKKSQASSINMATQQPVP